MRRALLGVAVAFSLTACATTPSTHLTEGKALADAWSAFDAASTTLDSLAKAGALSASEKATILADGPKVENALNAATTAYDASDDATAGQNIAAATGLITQLATIVSAHK